MISKEERKRKLDEIQHGQPVRTGIPITYKGVRREFNVYQIPVDYLIFNKDNGRIGAEVSSFSKESHELNPETADSDQEKIEDFLWKSSEDRNSITMESLAKEGQKLHGIVTADGVIVDGNRRAMLLKRINRESAKWIGRGIDVSRAAYFDALILPEDATEKEVNKLETEYQMGEDAKVDYDAIEKYLKCRNLIKVGWNKSEIAQMMSLGSGGENKVQEMLDVLKLMDEYLSYLGEDYENMYVLLEKREDQFLNLFQWLKKYKSGSTNVDWEYNQDLDVNELKYIGFDYIRALYEGKEMRHIGSSGARNKGIFCFEDIWKTFVRRHSEVTQINDELESVSDLLSTHSLKEALMKREADWINKAKPILEKNLKTGIAAIDVITETVEPSIILNKAFTLLNQVNPESNGFKGFQENFELLEGMDRRISELKGYFRT